jgi:hyperosmotically inducible periplasmic protein
MDRHVIAALVVALVGCEKAEGEMKMRDTTKADNAPADNTKKNERDRGTDAPTPGDQAENEVDRTITQKIRQGVVKDDAMSMSAKNVKIITSAGTVTLRGPVKTEKEKADIEALAKSVEGVKQVVNELEVAP